MQVDVRNDNLDIVNAIHGINAISQEKRLMATNVVERNVDEE